MATFPASFSTPTLYKLIFLSPNKPATRIKCSLSKSSNFESRNSIKILRTRIRAVQREESVVLEEGDNEIITKLNGSVNGSANGNYGYGNGSIEKSTNGSLKIESQNGSLAKYANGNGNGSVATRIRAVQREESVVLEEGDNEIITKLNGSVNGSANGNYGYGNGSIEKSTNGSLKIESQNGSLAKYANGNGNGSVAVNTGKEMVEVVKVKEGIKKNKSVEEIGQEDAWFKQIAQDQVEVSVAPGGRWSRFKTYSTIQRTLEIWGFVLTFLFRVWLNNQKFSYRGGMTEEKKVQKRKVLAKWLKENILRLGPTFIKIGQQFSTRVDILAQEYVDQLSELQDQVPPFPSETALAIVEEELGAPLDDIFERFDREPIAAASLGQVHRAKLKGQEVVVKVQRPGLKDLFDIDLKNLRVIAEYLQKVDPKSDGAKRDWVAIYDECASVLYQEIDYTMEAANAEKFADNFKDMDYVKVPTIYWEYTTPQVLTMEYVPGIKINRIQALDQLGVDRKRLGRYAVESYLEQILSHGFFHADPVSHPIFFFFPVLSRENTLQEQGDLKLRVRALESERAFQRVAAVQSTVGSAVAAGSLINLATILYLNSIRTPAVIAYTFCAFFGLQVLIGIFKVKKLDQRERLITGTA
ncbi:protein ACTIVITY OF BC1 COMPLEX KINASE 8, chloroplastic-like [Olea europaea var. sylvestris]|uniref:protein ACTIVITY OF BC1 COMPLEX KINASE 8, chloroplastic-like n=1 Tax=Olea europaea var. sylvestris TaxID=158386 RepID=UPI000C1CFBBD|nr:protein ACTIVITY OF BC1 COMPLEX KINASE 8, chloroplastic-like [Olea europaea var. sylvestris]